VRLAAALGPAARHRLVDGERELDLARVSAVWNRRLWLPAMDPELDPRFVDGCRRESVAALDGFLDGLAHARWINALSASRRAENKLLQLRLAQRHGLAVPRTLVTNDPDELRSFHAELEGRVVAKLLTRLETSMEQTAFHVATSPVSEADVRDGELLRHSPMVFQEAVPKDVELRVAWVDGRSFAGAIDASGSAAGRTDWREADPSEAAWRADELPPEVDARLGRLLRDLGLAYGAVDLIRTPGGEHVFLEVNPDGEWGMLERDLDLPIADALAEALAGAPGSVPEERTT